MYNSDEKNILLTQVNSAILYGIKNHNKIKVKISDFPDVLREIRACFVTLYLDNILRGCIGSLTASQALIVDVSDNAFSAAFNDPRFPALSFQEFNKTSVEISVLSNPVKMKFECEEELLSQLNIGIDGLVFEYKHYRSTYLPSVWSSLSTPKSFVNSLKNKAGLKSDFWSKQICCSRYTTEIIN